MLAGQSEGRALLRVPIFLRCRCHPTALETPAKTKTVRLIGETGNGERGTLKDCGLMDINGYRARVFFFFFLLEGIGPLGAGVLVF
jgi:hypothetical protein